MMVEKFKESLTIKVFNRKAFGDCSNFLAYNSPVSVQSSLLEEKAYIDLEDIDYSVKVSAGGCLCDTTPTVTKAGREFPS
jgi:hypothetical protein